MFYTRHGVQCCVAKLRRQPRWPATLCKADSAAPLRTYRGHSSEAQLRDSPATWAPPSAAAAAQADPPATRLLALSGAGVYTSMPADPSLLAVSPKEYSRATQQHGAGMQTPTVYSPAQATRTNQEHSMAFRLTPRLENPRPCWRCCQGVLPSNALSTPPLLAMLPRSTPEQRLEHPALATPEQRLQRYD